MRKANRPAESSASVSHSNLTTVRERKYRRRYSPEEDQIILENLRSFMELHNVTDANTLVGFDTGNSVEKKFRKANGFWEHLAQNLSDRNWASVYSRTRILINPPKKTGRFSAEEREKLLSLHKQFGNKWMKIRAHHEDRAYNSVLGTIRYAWMPREERLLIRAMRKVVGKEKMLLPVFDLPWEDIAKYVPLKTAEYCRTHWKNVLYEKFNYGPPRFPKANRACLIYMMHSNIVQREEFVDWDAVFQAFRSYVPTYSTLRMHWDDLRYLVPNHAQRDHEDIVLYLYHMHLPKLLEKCSLQLSDIERMCKLREFKKRIES